MLWNGLAIFSNEEFGKVRVAMINGEPWFVASDVAKALGYADPASAVRQHCEKVNKISQLGKTPNRQTPPVMIMIIPEEDVYALIFGSHLPSAKKFRRWLCDVVLPQIRKTGGYGRQQITAEDILKDPRAMATMFTAYAEQQEQLALTSAQLEKAQADKQVFEDACYKLAANSGILPGLS